MKKFILIGFAFLLASATLAQNISLDMTYGTAGYASGQANNNFINDAIIQADGKVVVAGPLDFNTEFYVSRHNVDGSYDTTFNGTGFLINESVPNSKEEIYDIIIQADGKLIISGQADVNPSLFGVRNDALMVRINTDGTLDSSFGNNGYVKIDLGSEDDFMGDVAVASDGSIYAIGQTQPPASDDDIAVLLKYTATGILDSGWGTSGMVPVAISNEVVFSALRILADGSIVIGGVEEISSTDTDFVIVKYNADGTLATGFGTGGIVRTDFNSTFDNLNNLLIKSTGEIVALGNSGGNGQVAGLAIAQYDSSTGQLDLTFDTDGKIVIPINSSGYGVHFGRQIKETSDGGLFAIAQTIANNNYDFNITRLNSDGSAVTAFGNNGQFLVADAARQDYARNILLQDDGKIIIAGMRTSSTSTSRRVFLARFQNAIPVGITESSQFEGISIYPNPVEDQLYIRSQSIPDRLELYGITGRRFEVLYDQDGINMSQYAPGTYVLQIWIDNEVKVIKVIKT